jgi:hypothetical protein
VRRAHLAMTGVPDDAPDRRTTMADLRIALCLEIGIDIDDIAPASGHDHSRSGYESVRSSWQRALADDPGSSWLERNYREVRANWLAIRPDWDDDWLVPDAPAPDPLLIPLFELETTR